MIVNGVPLWFASSQCLGSHLEISYNSFEQGIPVLYYNGTFYTWGSDGILCYTTFPIDFDSCAPDKVIYNEDVTPELAQKTVLQMYRE